MTEAERLCTTIFTIYSPSTPHHTMSVMRIDLTIHDNDYYIVASGWLVWCSDFGEGLSTSGRRCHLVVVFLRFSSQKMSQVTKYKS